MQARNGYQRVVKKVGQMGMTPIQFTGRIVVQTLWYGIYQNNIAKGMSDQQASMEATKWIHRTQPGGTAKDSAAIYDSNSTIMKFLLMFSNQINKNLNVAYDIPYSLKHGMYEKAFRNTIGLGLAMAGIMLLEGHFEDEDDDGRWDDIGKGILGQILGMSPIFGSDIKNIVFDKQYSGNGLPMMTELGQFVKAIGSNDSDRITDRFINFSLSGIEVSGLPAGQARKIYNAFTNDRKFNVGYLLVHDFGE